MGLSAHTVTHFRQQGGCDVPHLVVTNGRKSLVGHDNAWSMLKACPQAQEDGWL